MQDAFYCGTIVISLHKDSYIIFNPIEPTIYDLASKTNAVGQDLEVTKGAPFNNFCRLKCK